MTRPDRPKAIVVGAGVAGLTAAHELALRDFEVHVVERAQDERFAPPPGGTIRPKRELAAVGGMAKSEYLYFERARLDEVVPGQLKDARELASGEVAEQWLALIPLDPRSGPPVLLDGHEPSTIARRELVHATLYYRFQHQLPDARRVDLDAVLEQITGAKSPRIVPHFAWMRELGTLCEELAGDDGLALLTWNRASSEVDGGEVIELAGEHGYRYFPSFYYHLFDTMKRTPVRSHAHTVYDNLRSNDHFVIGSSDGAPADRISRKPPNNLGELLQLQRVIQQRLGMRMGDILRYQTRLLQYATSCRKRREELQFVSWSDYLQLGEGFSNAFRTAMDQWPQALVGLNGATADAHTFGNIIVQQLADQLTHRDLRDASLNGPTTNAWFDHWRRHLVEDLGVIFHHDEALALVALERPDAGPTGDGEVRAIFAHGLQYADAGSEVAEHYPKWWPGELPQDPRRELPANAYLVLATCPRETLRLSETICGPPSSADSVAPPPVFRELQALLANGPGRFSPKQLTEQNPGITLKHFFGVQYFPLDSSLPMTPGHMYCPGSAWGLSAQMRSSADDGGPLPLCLSVDIGSFASLSALANGERDVAWKCTRQTLGQTVWADVMRALETDAPRRTIFYIPRALVFDDAPLPTWFDIAPDTNEREQWFQLYLTPWFHEPNATDADGTAVPVFNNEPFLAQPPTSIGHGPGAIDYDRPEKGYDVVWGNVVSCGAYMNTFTRLNTMEAANESARHAVNGIVQKLVGHTDLSPRHCEVVPLEQREPDSLRLFKDIDERLFEDGLPHLFEILKTDAFLRNAFPSDDDDTADQETTAQAEATFDALAGLVTGIETNLEALGAVLPLAWMRFLDSRERRG